VMELKKQLELAGASVVAVGLTVAVFKTYKGIKRRRLAKAKEIRDLQLYDMVMRVHGDPNKSDWELEVHQEQNRDKNEVAVAVFGNFNVGKTHLINKLAGTNLPSTEMDHTMGLSFKSTKQGLLWIDTAGVGAPYDKRKQSPEEADATEKLIAELAYWLSDVQIVVVSHCSLGDQVIMNHLQALQKRERRVGKDLLIVVHNYCRIADPRMLEITFLNDVVSKFGLEEIALPERGRPNSKRRVWVGRHDPDDYPIYHVVLGLEGTPAGDQYNEQSYSAIHHLCIAKLGFNARYDYLESALIKLNDHGLLESFYNTDTRLRLNEMRNKLVPDYNYAPHDHSNGFTHHNDNGGSYHHVDNDVNMQTVVAPPSDSHSQSYVHAPASPPQPEERQWHEISKDPQAAIRQVEAMLRAPFDDDPITRLKFHN